MANPAFYRPSFVSADLGLHRSTIYHHIREGLYPPPVKLGALASGFPAYEHNAIKNARIAGKTDEEIRALVAELVAARTKADA